MNDALAGGETAMAGWGVGHFNPWGSDSTFVFTIDHHVQIFTQHQTADDAPDPPVLKTCATATFIVGPSFCGVLDPQTGGPVSIDRIALEGC